VIESTGDSEFDAIMKSHGIISPVETPDNSKDEDFIHSPPPTGTQIVSGNFITLIFFMGGNH